MMKRVISFLTTVILLIYSATAFADTNKYTIQFDNITAASYQINALVQGSQCYNMTDPSYWNNGVIGPNAIISEVVPTSNLDCANWIYEVRTPDNQTLLAKVIYVDSGGNLYGSVQQRSANSPFQINCTQDILNFEVDCSIKRNAMI